MRLILIVILIFMNYTFAQRIQFDHNEVYIFGNNITSKKTVLEIAFPKQTDNSRLSIKIIQKRLELSNLFKKVRVIKNESEKISIFLTEKKYFRILPVATLHNDIWKWDNISAGLVFNHNNFLGRNYNLSITGIYGYTQRYEIALKRLKFKKLYLNTTIGHKIIHHKAPIDSIYKKNHISYWKNTLGKKINNKNSVFCKTNFFYNNIQSKKNLFPAIGIGYQFISLNSLVLATKGNFFKTELLNKGLGNYDLDFWNLNTSYRTYLPFIKGKPDKLNFSFLLKNRIVVGNKLPNFYKIYLGYEEKLRGFQNYKEIGDDFYKFGFYLRNKTFSIPNLYPKFLLGKRNNIVDFYTEIFAEIVSLSDKIYSFDERKTIVSGGVSFYAKMPLIIFPIRIDIALSSKEEIAFKNISYTISIDGFDL